MLDQPVVRSESFTRTLTYNTGKFESKIKIAYREFYGINDRSYACPLFDLPLEYELLPTGYTLIIYRDIKIEVIDATSAKSSSKLSVTMVSLGIGRSCLESGAI